MRCANTRITQKKEILESLPSGECLERDVLTLALHGINGDSAGNYHLMDKDSPRGWEFHRELPAHLP
jgi:hypothetical protein